MPKPGAGPSTTLWATPRMVMNYEGGILAGGSVVEKSDYAAGKYWPAFFEDQCWIKNTANNPNTDVKRYLAEGAGILNNGNYGDYRFSTDVKPSQKYPAWAGKLRLLKSTDALPRTCDPAQCGPEHRLTSVDQFMAAIGSGGGGAAAGIEIQVGD